MKTQSSAKLVKKGQHKVPQIQARVESATDQNIWSRAVRSWVSEFQQDQRGESLKAFDSLFKAVVPQAESVD